VQIRAFNTDVLSEVPANKPAPNVAYFGRFDFFATPLQGAVAARDATMRHRNNRELNLLRQLYGETFLQTVVFEPKSSKQATMTWALPQKELEELKGDLTEVLVGSEMRRLREIWRELRHPRAGAPRGARADALGQRPGQRAGRAAADRALCQRRGSGNRRGPAPRPLSDVHPAQCAPKAQNPQWRRVPPG